MRPHVETSEEVFVFKAKSRGNKLIRLFSLFGDLDL